MANDDDDIDLAVELPHEDREPLDSPFEFFIEGVPVSHQTKNRDALRAWKARVTAEALMWRGPDKGALAGSTYATILYFPSAPMQGDVDNIVKAILDGMVDVAYMDDQQVQRVLIQKFEPGQVVLQVDTEVLASALDTPPPVVYVRVDNEATKKDVMP